MCRLIACLFSCVCLINMHNCLANRYFARSLLGDRLNGHTPVISFRSIVHSKIATIRNMKIQLLTSYPAKNPDTITSILSLCDYPSYRHTLQITNTHSIWTIMFFMHSIICVVCSIFLCSSERRRKETSRRKEKHEKSDLYGLNWTLTIGRMQTHTHYNYCTKYCVPDE